MLKWCPANQTQFSFLIGVVNDYVFLKCSHLKTALLRTKYYKKCKTTSGVNVICQLSSGSPTAMQQNEDHSCFTEWNKKFQIWHQCFCKQTNFHGFIFNFGECLQKLLAPTSLNIPVKKKSLGFWWKGMDRQILASKTFLQNVDSIFKVLTQMVIGSWIKPLSYY